jgi:hypothetical protein
MLLNSDDATAHVRSGAMTYSYTPQAEYRSSKLAWSLVGLLAVAGMFWLILFAGATAHALPVAIVGSSCRPDSTPTVDPEGVAVSCARIQYTDLYVWSRIPDTVPVPVSATGIDVREGKPENICAKQTGWSVSKCSTAIANATYLGDGRDTRE